MLHASKQSTASTSNSICLLFPPTS
jgi:hypothetical protein